MRARHATTFALPLAAALLAAATAAAAVVERIEVEGGDLVRFHLSEPRVARVVGLPARLPVKARIAVDLDDTTLGPEAKQPVPGSGVIVRVRPEQLVNREMVRATIELTRPVGFTVESAGNTVTVRLQFAKDAAPAAPHVEPPKPAPPGP